MIWPSGINGVAPFNPDPLDPIQIGADPFDSTLCDIGYDLVNAGGGAYPYRPGDALRPLVISAGLDGRFGIRFYAADQTALPTSGFMSATSSASSVMVTGSASFKSPPYWTFGSFNWPDPYWPRESMGSRVGAVLSSSADPAGDPIGVELNPSPLPPAFILNPSSDTNYVIHAGNNVSNLDESGAAP